MRSRRIAAALGLLLLALAAAAPAAEADYQMPWCAAAGGVAEYVLPDRTRVDCLTESHAVEHDFARKWAEAIGQALYYAARTGKRAGVVLIIEQWSDLHYVDRLFAAITTHRLPIDVWLIH